MSAMVPFAICGALYIVVAVLGERTPKGAQIAERMAARMERL